MTSTDATQVRHDAQQLTGQYVRMDLRGDEAFGGVTLRWGTVRQVTADSVIVDDYHDSAGFGAYPDYGKHDGVEVPLWVILRIARKQGIA